MSRTTIPAATVKVRRDVGEVLAPAFAAAAREGAARLHTVRPGQIVDLVQLAERTTLDGVLAVFGSSDDAMRADVREAVRLLGRVGLDPANPGSIRMDDVPAGQANPRDGRSRGIVALRAAARELLESAGPDAPIWSVVGGFGAWPKPAAVDRAAAVILGGYARGASVLERQLDDMAHDPARAWSIRDQVHALAAAGDFGAAPPWWMQQAKLVSLLEDQRPTPMTAAGRMRSATVAPRPSTSARPSAAELSALMEDTALAMAGIGTGAVATTVALSVTEAAGSPRIAPQRSARRGSPAQVRIDVRAAGDGVDVWTALAARSKRQQPPIDHRHPWGTSIPDHEWRKVPLLFAGKAVEAHVMIVPATRRGGRLPPIVVLPGLGDTAEAYLPLARALHRDRDLIVLQPLGTGCTAEMSRVLTPEQMIDATPHVLEAVRSALGIDRWFVLGTSLGGSQAIEYIAAHREVVVGGLAVGPVGFSDLTWPLRLRARLSPSIFPDTMAHVPGAIALIGLFQAIGGLPPPGQLHEFVEASTMHDVVATQAVLCQAVPLAEKLRAEIAGNPLTPGVVTAVFGQRDTIISRLPETVDALGALGVSSTVVQGAPHAFHMTRIADLARLIQDALRRSLGVCIVD